jgi:hypothetical protein
VKGDASSEDPMEILVSALGLIFYKITILLVGALFAVLGYRLFRVGYYEKAGELKAAWGKSHLILKQTAPGVFFALFGSFIVIVGAWKPIELRFPSQTAVSTEDDTESSNVRAIMKKVSGGEEVTADERKILASWLSKSASRPGFTGIAFDLDLLSRIRGPSS